MNTKPEFFGEKFFSFQGRLGREKFLTYNIVTTLLFFVCFFFVNLVVGSIFQIRSEKFVAIFVVLPFFISLLGLTVRRIHDLGSSGWLLLIPIGISVFAVVFKGSSIFDILSFPAILFYLYISIWPGQLHENEYGVPPRGVRGKFLSQKEKFKKEFFSFQGRVGRKWFLLPVLFLISELGSIAGLVENGFVTLGLLETHPELVPRQSATAVAIMLILYISLLIVSVFSYSSFFVRRIKDLGWPPVIAIFPIGLVIAPPIISIYLVMNADPTALLMHAIGRTSLEPDWVGLLWIAKVIVLLFLMIMKGNSKSNKYGENPIFHSDTFPVAVLSEKMSDKFSANL